MLELYPWSRYPIQDLGLPNFDSAVPVGPVPENRMVYAGIRSFSRAILDWPRSVNSSVSTDENAFPVKRSSLVDYDTSSVLYLQTRTPSISRCSIAAALA